MTAKPAASICAIDVETTGLDDERHEMWELALIVRRPGEEPVEKLYQFPVRLETAEPKALEISRFWSRHDQVPWPGDPDLEIVKAREIAKLTDGAYLVGSIPSFDAGFVGAYLRAHRAAPSWQYRLVCVESLAAGALGVRPPWDTSELGQRLGVPKDPATQHTAMGDARWAMKIYDAVMALPTLPSRRADAAPTPTPPEPDQVSELESPDTAEPPTPAKSKLAYPSKTEPSLCVVCGVEVAPRQALVSFSVHREVLCMEGDLGGCFGRKANPQEIS